MIVQDVPPAPPAAVAPVPWDLTVGLINATVQIDQPLDQSTRKVGTGFLISAPDLTARRAWC